MGEEKEGKKTISIRGLDERLYEQIVLLARESGKTIGEILNEAMKILLATVNKASTIGKGFVEGLKESTNTLEVTGIEELVIERNDIESIDKPIVFKNIKRLEIADDVPYELFDKKVKSIILCNELIIPRNYPKLKVAQKCRLVKVIKTRK